MGLHRSKGQFVSFQEPPGVNDCLRQLANPRQHIFLAAPGGLSFFFEVCVRVRKCFF